MNSEMNKDNIKVIQRVVTTLSIDDIDLNIRDTPADGMEPIINMIGENHVVAGYLIDDKDCENPLESADGQGFIYTTNSRLTNHDPAAILEALGYDSDYEPDYELIDGSVERDRYVEHFTANATVEDCERHGWVKTDAEESDADFIEACAIEDYEEHKGGVFSDELENIRHELWVEGRTNGTIGNPYVIDVNCMEQSSSYYAQQPGTTPLEIENVNALWVPDDIATENIVYGAIQSLLPAGTRVEYVNTEAKDNDIAYILPNGETKAGFNNFVDAIKAAADVQNIELQSEKIIEAGRSIAFEYAKGVCNEYTKWVSGECYGVVVETFEKATDGNWAQIDHDVVCGYVGGQYAENSLKEAVNNRVEGFEVEAKSIKEEVKQAVSGTLSGAQLTALKDVAQAKPEHDSEHEQGHEAE